jgi:hypothetical protein
MILTPDEIKGRILLLSQKHKSTGDELDDFTESELIEQEAERLIVDYCVNKGYLINGFPTEKKLLPIEELEEDYFCRERYQLYLDTLSTKYDDVAELTWHYVSCFWEEQYDNKEDYVQSLIDTLGLFYDVKL